MKLLVHHGMHHGMLWQAGEMAGWLAGGRSVFYRACVSKFTLIDHNGSTLTLLKKKHVVLSAGTTAAAAYVRSVAIRECVAFTKRLDRIFLPVCICVSPYFFCLSLCPSYSLNSFFRIRMRQKIAYAMDSCSYKHASAAPL